VRLGFGIYGSLDQVSGGFFYDRNLVRHLREHDDRVEVVSIPWRLYGRNLLDNLSRDLFRRLRGAPWDLMVQDELIHPSLFYLNRRLRPRINYPLVAVVHHLRSRELRPAWQNRFYRAIERRYLATMDAFVCVSQTTKKDVEDLVGAGRPSVVATPGGDGLAGRISKEQVEARVVADGPLKIIFAGSLIPRKQLHTLLGALALLRRENWLLTIAGSLTADPGYVRGTRNLLKISELAPKVTLRGNLKREELAAELASGDVLAVPSSYEGFGIVYLEAMRFGLPAIASTAGAAHEIITHGRDGFLVPVGEPGPLADCIQVLLRDRKRLLEMSLAAYENAARFPTWEESAARVRAFLQGFSSNGKNR
jgi:glycosyltransferase involved in cell wall biosynthesis